MSRKWDRHAILAEIKRRGETFVSLEKRYGLLPHSLTVALSRPFPKAERVISDFLDVPIGTLFAYRISPIRKSQKLRRLDVSRVAPDSESQKCTPSPDMETAA